uniref:WASH complex subunit 3 isoform X1 n=1 Tax=Pristiophorus japonicus TaxID=55135 RepID=UPI00398F1C19
MSDFESPAIESGLYIGNMLVDPVWWLMCDGHHTRVSSTPGAQDWNIGSFIETSANSSLLVWKRIIVRGTVYDDDVDPDVPASVTAGFRPLSISRLPTSCSRARFSSSPAFLSCCALPLVGLKFHQNIESTTQIKADSPTDNAITVAKDPRYARYLKMVQVGVPLMAIRNKMISEGLKPDLLETPDAPVPDGVKEDEGDSSGSESSFSD